MKKILFAVLAVIMTLSVSAQSQAKCCNEDAKQHKVVYSAETRAMMRTDKIANIVEDLKASERKKIVKFFTDNFKEMDKQRAAGEECDMRAFRKECNEMLKKVLGQERYAKFAEAKKLQRLEKQKMHAVKGCSNHGENKYSRCEK